MNVGSLHKQHRESSQWDHVTVILDLFSTRTSTIWCVCTASYFSFIIRIITHYKFVECIRVRLGQIKFVYIFFTIWNFGSSGLLWLLVVCLYVFFLNTKCKNTKRMPSISVKHTGPKGIFFSLQGKFHLKVIVAKQYHICP